MEVIVKLSKKDLSLDPVFYIRKLFFSTSDRASKKVRNTREPDLRVA